MQKKKRHKAKRGCNYRSGFKKKTMLYATFGQLIRKSE